MDNSKRSLTIRETDNAPSLESLSHALFTINRHAKTAPNPKFLYHLKKTALEKLLKEGKAIKKGLHYSKNPRFSQQRSDLLVTVGEFCFHMPPKKEDFSTLPHLGDQSGSYRNPKVRMPLGKAKEILIKYTGITEENDHPKTNRRVPYKKPVFKRLGDSY